MWAEGGSADYPFGTDSLATPRLATNTQASDGLRAAIPKDLDNFELVRRDDKQLYVRRLR